MRAYHFFMKFWRSFVIGFRCGMVTLFCIGAVLGTLYLLMYSG